MSRIARKTQQIFGGSLVPGGNLAKWGSLKDGAADYSADPALIQTAEWLNGLNGAVIGNRSPTQEDLNALFYVLSYQLAYGFQAGIAEWDANTVYFKHDRARIPGWNLDVASRIDNNTGLDPTADRTNWTIVGGSVKAAATTSSTQLILCDGNGHRISFAAAIADPFGLLNGSSQYVVPVTGTYKVFASLQVDNYGPNPVNVSTVEFGLRAIVNGAVASNAGDSVPGPAGNRWYPKIAGDVINANAGDLVEIQLVGTDGAGTHQVSVSNSQWSIDRF